MRPRLSHWCRDVFGNAGPLRAAAILFLALGFWQPCGAQQASPEARSGTWTPLSIEQVRDTASLALPRSVSGVDAKLVKVTRRPDLEYLLSTIVQRRGSQGLFLYQVEIPSQASYDGPVDMDRRRRGSETRSLRTLQLREHGKTRGRCCGVQSLRVGTFIVALQIRTVEFRGIFPGDYGPIPAGRGCARPGHPARVRRAALLHGVRRSVEIHRRVFTMVARFFGCGNRVPVGAQNRNRTRWALPRHAEPCGHNRWRAPAGAAVADGNFTGGECAGHVYANDFPKGASVDVL